MPIRGRRGMSIMTLFRGRAPEVPKTRNLLPFALTFLFLTVAAGIEKAPAVDCPPCECKVCHGPVGPHAGGYPSCNSCHGFPPVDIAGLVSIPSPTGGTTAGAHAKHATPAGYNYTCQTCHFNGMPTTAIIENPLLLQMGFSRATSGAIYDGRTLQAPYLYDNTNGTTLTTNGAMTCSNTYCHSAGTGGTMNMGTPWTSPLGDPRPVAPNTSPGWAAGGPLACTTCHGYPPSYAQDNPKSNSHMYGQSAGVAHRQSCNICHYGTTTDGATITGIDNHANSVYDVVPDPVNLTVYGPVNFTYSYDAGGGKCSNISCHGGTDYWWGRASILAPIAVTYGPACYEAQMYPNFSGGGTAPYTCNWDFGDGASSSVCSVDHLFASAGPFSVTVSGRDAGNHPFSSTASVTPQTANIPPTVNDTVTVACSVVTLTDLSTDPDAATCGHSGTALETINWGNGTTSTGNVTLSGSPSNAVFTKTYTGSGTYNIIHTVRDNANATASRTTTAVRVPSTNTVGGRATTSGGAGISGVLMVLKQSGVTRATATTDANGNYTFNYAAGCGDWTVLAYKSGSSFVDNPRAFAVAGSNVTVNFVTP
jgi:predicted CxxxxCH...CXXCH cytochrome family protein